MFFFNICQRWLILIGWLLSPYYVSAQPVPQEKIAPLLNQIHERLDSIREDIYGNCYLEGIYTKNLKQNSGTLPVHFRYWSRQNQYFRIDLLDKEAQVVERLIIRPEGFLRWKDSQAGLALVNYGDGKQGRSYLFGYPFYLGSTRVIGVGPENWFAGPTNIEGYPQKTEGTTVDISAARNTEGETELDVHSVSEKGASDFYIVFHSKEVPAIKKFKLVVTVDDQQHSRTVTDFTYNEKSEQYFIPVRVVENRINKNGELLITTTEINKVDLTSQPAGLFSLEAQGVNNQGNPWIRRLIILGICTVLLGAYLAYRRKQT